MKGTLEQRFWNYVNKRGEDECWEWTGAINSWGYGKLRLGYKMKQAHRVSYILHYGEPPNGLDICHKCNNKRCVNPKHLYAGTESENLMQASRDGLLKPKKGEDHPAHVLTEKQVIEIRQYSAIGPASLARIYGVNASTIRAILHNRKWKHLL